MTVAAALAVTQLAIRFMISPTFFLCSMVHLHLVRDFKRYLLGRVTKMKFSINPIIIF